MSDRSVMVLPVPVGIWGGEGRRGGMEDSGRERRRGSRARKHEVALGCKLGALEAYSTEASPFGPALLC